MKARYRTILLFVFFLNLILAPVHSEQQTPPPPGPPPALHLPVPQEKTLSNGLRVVVVELKGVPLVTTSLVVRHGSESDPEDLSGLADMTAALLTKGTRTRSAPQIAQAIEALGGTLQGYAGWDASSVSTNVISSKIESAMEILTDVVINPVFDQEEIERLRQQYLDGLKVALQQPGTVARYVAARVLFGNTQYGHPASGTPDSLTKISRQHIAEFHSTCYRPDRSILVIGGHIQPEAAFAIAEKFFGKWKNGSSAVQKAKDEDLPQQKGLRIVAIDMPEAAQAAVIYGHLGIRRKDPGYFKAVVTNSVFGGGYSSRLNQEIRIKRGLSYGAGSNLDARKEVGPFYASTQTKNESATEVAALIVSELKKLASEPPSIAELTPRKAALVGSFGRSLETTDGVVSELANLSVYGIELSEINRYIQKLEVVKPEEVLQFTRSHLNPESGTIIIAGKAEVFLEPLRKQFGHVEVIPLQDLDLNSAKLRK
jgi:zinc protease